MIKRAKLKFNTSGPNLVNKHYTLKRESLIAKGVELVEDDRYFTIWAPRQSGKSTYFRMLSERLQAREGEYKIAQFNFENYGDAPPSALFTYIARETAENWGSPIRCDNFADLGNEIAAVKDRKCVLIIDEIEGLNPEFFGSFLHTLRSLYHSRDKHCLKSVIMVGVINIVGVVQDNASPFNIADNLDVPYFTREETFALLHMHEEQTGQLFHEKVKEQISYITGNQPGLVNGFAYQLVERNPLKPVIHYDDYLKVEYRYINIAVDKNISNIINKAKQHRKFVEGLLFSDKPVKFTINDEKMKYLSSYGVITSDAEGMVTFDVPLYKKALLDAFYPHSNGESDRFFRDVDSSGFLGKKGEIDFKALIDNYKAYVKKRSFKYFREKDEETGTYKSLKEAALAYSFETYIQSFLQETGGKSYLEPHTGLGRSDLIINLHDHEYVVEFKIYRNPAQFRKGKEQLAYYAESIQVREGIYLVFAANTVKLPAIKEESATVGKAIIKTFIIYYDEEKDF